MRNLSRPSLQAMIQISRSVLLVKITLLDGFDRAIYPIVWSTSPRIHHLYNRAVEGKEMVT